MEPHPSVTTGALKGLKQIGENEFEATVARGSELKTVRFRLYPDRHPTDADVYLVCYGNE